MTDQPMSEEPMSWEIREGDCRERMAEMPDASVDAIVTDPPYGLSFMGKGWDHGVPGVPFWTEAMRVAKPGAHLLAFGGTRTYHRLACAIEDAGWEIRDCVMWVYGSGFPKSLDVSKAIDKARGRHNMSSDRALEFAEELRSVRKAANVSVQEMASWFPYKEVTKNWERRDAGFRLPSEQDGQILVERLGLGSGWLQEMRAEDARRLVSSSGTDRRNDGSVIGLGHSGKEWESTTDAARQWDGWGTALKPAWEPIIVARKPLIGTVAANVLAHGTGALNIDGCRVGTEQRINTPASPTSASRKSRVDAGYRNDAGFGPGSTGGEVTGRWPANLIHDGSEEATAPMGEAARFFYCAKASKADRDEGLDAFDEKASSSMPGRRNPDNAEWDTGNDVTSRFVSQRKNVHPTVKPTALMRYLCCLVTPPGGTVLDPFCGSGSTGKAAVREGFGFIGIEREAEYARIARCRIQAVKRRKRRTQ
jgi:DNA modification methylase